jgi:hypothetical protein
MRLIGSRFLRVSIRRIYAGSGRRHHIRATSSSREPAGGKAGEAGTPPAQGPGMTSRPKNGRTASQDRRRVRIATPTPDVAQLLRDLDLAWMLDARRMPAANEPMRSSRLS